MSDGLSDSLQKAATTVVAAVAAFCLFLLSYIVLFSVAKPYWLCGRDVQTGSESYHTYYVVNPGPWKSRSPAIEFQPQANAAVVDFSPGVSVETKLNKLWVHPDEGLAPGCAYFVTYRHSCVSNTEPVVAVVCDGKPCKFAPSFDLDLILKFLQFGCGALFLGCFVFWYLYMRTRAALRREKESTIRGAVEALLASREATYTVERAIVALGDWAKDSVNMNKVAKSRPVKKPTGVANNKKGSPS